MKAGFLPFHRPTIEEHHVQAVADTIRSGWLTTGKKVEEFERLFLEKVGGKHAVAVNSCTAALHLSLIALGIGSGHEVITSPITFASAVNVIEHVGARPLFIDVLDHDLTMDPRRLRDEIEGRASVRAIIATHFAGFPAHMDAIDDVARYWGVPVVTDAAHAIETRYHGRPSGQLGKVACYSFYATKNITTGEGGMLVTDDDRIAERARSLRLHGMTKDAWNRYGPKGYKHWDIVEPGWKYNLSDPAAALGIAQLGDLDAWHGKRTMLIGAYREHLPKSIGVVENPGDGIRPAHHLFVIRVPNRDKVMVRMQEAGIGVGVHFRAVHRLEYYQKKYGIPKGALPVAEKASDEVLSLPLYPSMEVADVRRVVSVLDEVLREGEEG